MSAYAPFPWRRAGAALLLLLPAACREENHYVPPPPPRVTVAPPAQERITRHVEATGNAAAVNSVDLVARVAGFVTEIGYRDGTPVPRGTVLFTIDPAPYEANLARARASQAAAEARVIQTTADFNRQASLGRDQFAAQSAVDSARGKRDEARAELSDSQAQVQLAELDLSYTRVAAPFDGIVTARQVSVGSYVGGGSVTQLARIVQLDPVWVTFTIGEQQAFRIRDEARSRGIRPDRSSTVEVEAALPTETGWPHRGTLDYIAPQVDAATGTIQLRAVFPNPERQLVPGAFVRVRVPIERDVAALTVPETAIGADQAGRYVRVVGEGNQVEQRRVRLGAPAGSRRVIEEGLAATDRVVVGGLQRAIPGQVVDPQPAAAATAAAAAAGAR